MRDQIVSTIYALMKKNKNIYFLTGDLGFHALESLRDFGNRFINCGIAEANMIGVASGLALSGKRVYVYSIIPFTTLRCLEQIRNDICFQNLDITILGVGAGFSYGVLGKTHFALEDLGLMRLLPNMKVLIPSDGNEGQAIIRTLHKAKGPAYISIGKVKDNFNDYKYSYKIGLPTQILSGPDITIYSCGQLLWEVKKACEVLRQKYNIKANLINVSSINPANTKIIQNYARNKKMIFVIDEHTYNGGLSGLISQSLISLKNLAPIKFICLKNKVYKRIGSRDFLLKHHNLSTQKIISQILEKLCI